MTLSASDVQLSRLSDFVAAKMGLHFPRERWRDLERGISSAVRESGFANTESYIQWLVSSPLKSSQIEILASHLTVGETYFFREKRSFEALEGYVLSELIRSRRKSERRLRIWSAGCCTGEEPYSIAILLSQMIPDWKEWSITILATDINPRFLQKASEGIYNSWSFRDTPRGIQERYFKRKKDGRFEIRPHVKEMVTFSYLNLAEDAYPSLSNNTNGMDLIFCRNVLMYFAPERAEKAVHSFYRSLVDSGWLIVSASEASHTLFSPFFTVNLPGAIFYRKDSHEFQGIEIVSCRLNEEAAYSSQPTCNLVSRSEPEVNVLTGSVDPAPSVVEEPREAESAPSAYCEALTLHELGHYAEAAEKIHAQLEATPEDAKAMALLTRVYANQGKLAEALKWCEKAIAADKLNPSYHYLRAVILQEQGAMEEARVSLKGTLYLDQTFVLAYVALGNISQRKEKFGESEKHFENALSLLRAYRQEDILPESEGMTVGRLIEIIRSTSCREILR